MAARTNTEVESNLSTFIPLIIVSPLASVRCPHCEGEFSIDGKRWRAPLMSTIKPDTEIFGRPCPYCFKTSLIPPDFYPKNRRPNRPAKR